MCGVGKGTAKGKGTTTEAVNHPSKTLFPDQIILGDAGMVNGSRRFQLQTYFRYISSYGTITVPTGFITDGASIPKCFWNILSPFDEYFGAALVHDFLYSRRSDHHFQTERWLADEIFKEAMWNIGVPWYKRESIFRAVRLFGWTAYKKK